MLEAVRMRTQVELVFGSVDCVNAEVLQDDWDWQEK